jgi:hypothetical protein
MDRDELKEELKQAYRDGAFSLQEYLAELKALRDDSANEKKRERSSSGSASDGAQPDRNESEEKEGEEEEEEEEESAEAEDESDGIRGLFEEEEEEEDLVDEDGMPLVSPNRSTNSSPRFDSPDDDMREEEEPVEEPVDALWSAGETAVHPTKGTVTIIKVGTAAADFINAGRVYIKLSKLKKGSKRVYETGHSWVLPPELEPVEEVPEGQ